MKKIKNNRHLQEQRMTLRVRELELENSIRKDWVELKEKIKPTSIIENSKESSNWLTGLLHVASTSLTRNLLQKAEEKIEEGTDKGIEYISHRFTRSRNKKN
ncbi:MAG TPA: hypothetical protein VFV08_11105 [Puia sp.]|nr:hypothetical protein [Puia sp.]